MFAFVLQFEMTKNVDINNKTKKYLLNHTKKDEIAVNIL